MKPVTLYHPNGATFDCDTEERKEAFIADGWTDRKPAKPKPPKPDATPAPVESNGEAEDEGGSDAADDGAGSK